MNEPLLERESLNHKGHKDHKGRTASVSFVFFVVLAFTAAGLVVRAQRGRPGGGAQEGLAFRFVGPTVGNRVASVAGVPGDPHDLLRGRRVGRRMEDDRRRYPLAAGVGQHAGCGDWRARGCADRADHRLGRHRRSVGDSRQRRDRRRHLQVGRRRRARGRTWASTKPAASRGSSSTRRIPTSCSSARPDALTGPQQEKGVYRTIDGGQKWERVLFADENTGCSGLTMDAKNPRTLCRRHLAGRNASVGRAVAAAPAARFTSRTMAARSGRRSRATGCRNRRSGRSTSRSRRPIRTASTR